MAKALLGHLGGPDPRLVDELRRLRRRVTDLETEIGRLLAERELLVEPAFDSSLPAVPAGVAADVVADLDELARRRDRTAALT